MLRNTKWKLEKPKVKVVFRLQFHATNIPQSGWEKLFICFIPNESGKVIAKTSKANVRNGSCKWADPIYETTRLLVDSRNKRYDDKLYTLVVAMGTSRASVLGEATINLADYADASDPFIISFPLHGSENGTILHVTVQLLTGKTGFREFEQQFDRGLQSSSNLNREIEPTFATSSSSEFSISDEFGNKVNTKTHLESQSRDLITIEEETCIIHEGFSDSNASETNYADKHESMDLNGPAHTQSPPTEKPEKPNHQAWSSDYSIDNDLAIAHEENHRLKESLEMAESSVSQLKFEISTLHSHANDMTIETQKISQHLMAEIASGQKLEREIMVLKSESLKFKDELQQLKEIKLSSKLKQRTHDSGGSRILDHGYANGYSGFHGGQPTTHNQPTLVNGLLLVEDRIRELQKKIHIGFREPGSSFIHSDLDILLDIVQNLEKETVQEPRFSTNFDMVQGKSLELLSQLDEARLEKGNLIRKMDEMECYYEALVQELEENQKQILGQFQNLRYEHSTCVYTISACKDKILRFSEERHVLGCVNEELEKRILNAEKVVRDLEEKLEQILEEFRCLKNEHLTCVDTISSCKLENESIQRDMNDQMLKFTKEKHDLVCINKELEKNLEWLLGEFESLKSEHSKCVETISSCKSETESLQRDMNEQTLKLAKERKDLECVNEKLEKRATEFEELVEELEKKSETILEEFESLKNEHLTCGETISMCKNKNETLRNEMNNQILIFKERSVSGCVNEELEARMQELEENLRNVKNEHLTCGEIISKCKSETESIREAMNVEVLKFTEEKNSLICINEELEKRVMESEENQEQILEEFRSLENEHSKCVDTILNCKSETELIHNDMNIKISKLTEERNVLDCVKEDLEKRVLAADELVEDLEEKRNMILVEFESLKNDHLKCSETILNSKSENESIRNDFNNQIVRLTEANDALSRVNEDLEKRVKIGEELVQELEENREWILGDFQSLTNEHSKCAEIISTCKTETESIRRDLNVKISKLNEEKHKLNGVKEELEKRVMNTESALKKTRLNYSIAVTQLQKDLEMLSCQVSSMFETNQNLIKEIYSQSNVNENVFEVLNLNVYSKTLEETLFEVSINANKMKEELEMSNENIPDELEAEIVRIVLKAKFDEFNHKCNELMEKLSEQVKKSEEFKKVPEGPSESLRLVFMKEQCETVVQELKQQLFVSKRAGEDTLFKLQDALDEIDSRKKSEVSYLKKIEELSFKIVGLEADLESIEAELECSRLNLECCKEEKEKFVALMEECEEEKTKIAFELSMLREQLSREERHVGGDSSMAINASTSEIIELDKMKNEELVLSLMNSGSSFQDLRRGLAQLHKANEELGGMYPNFKDIPGDRNALERVLALEMELAQSLTAKKKSSIQSSFLKQHSDEEAVFKSFRDINELIKDTLEIKGKYVNVETELNEMHERYSQLSLQFAEVEGERQKLMMTIKNVRSPKNLVYRNRSSSETLDDNIL